MKHSPLMLLLCLSTTMWAQQTKRTIISGKIVNPTSNEVKLVHFNSWDWEDVPPVNLDPNGCFRFVLQLEKGRQLQIENSDNGWDFFFSAGDSVFLTLHPDQDDASIEASGKGANHCLWLAENAKWSAMLKPISKELLPAAAALKVDSAFRARRAHFENYCLQHQEVSEDFKLYYRLEYRYKPYRNKLRLPFTYAMNHKIDEADVPIPADMFAYFDTATINVDKYFISVNYQYFVIDVVRHTYENLLKRSNEQKAFSEIGCYQLGKIMLSGEKKWNFLATMLDYSFAQMDSVVLQEYQKFMNECPDEMILRRIKASYEKQQVMIIGKKAPDFTATDLNGKTVSLSDFEGKIVILDFWASWCAPCLRELMMENAQKLEEKYTQKGIVFLKVNVDANEELWKNTLDRLKIHSIGTHIHQPGGFNSLVAKAYGITGIPTYLILDKKGVIIENVPPRPSDAKLAEVLDKILAQ